MYELLLTGGWDYPEPTDDCGMEGCPADILADIMASEVE